MESIQFDEEQEFARPVVTTQSSAMVRFVLNTGFVKTERQADYVLLGVAVVATIAAFVLPYFLGPGSGTTPPHTGSTSTYTGPISR